MNESYFIEKSEKREIKLGHGKEKQKIQTTKSGIRQRVRKFILFQVSQFSFKANKNKVHFPVLSIGSFTILMIFFEIETINVGFIWLHFTKFIYKISWLSAHNGLM